MHCIFYPKSVAVIGVSSKPDNLGRNIMANLVEFGFTGAVYAVGPAGGVAETHFIYPTISDIPGPVDMAVIMTPARAVPGLLESCGQKGVRAAIVETAGFREYGEQGRRLEEQMLQVADRYGIRFVGPNCLGVINMENGFCVPFPRLQPIIKLGDVSIISQSGGVGISAMNLIADEGIGLNKFISVGNMLDISAEDALEYLIDDPGTAQIFLYLESMRQGRRLFELARRTSKPILVFKANIGGLGQTIAASHTASLSSDDRVVDAAFQQGNIIRIRDATSLLNNLKSLRLPHMRGKRLGIISRSGGHAVIAADSSELSGFELAQFPQTFLTEIEKYFRASVIKLTNPLDLGDLFDLEMVTQIVERTLQLDSVDGVVLLHIPISEAERKAVTQLIERVMAMVQRYDKPVALYISSPPEAIRALRQAYGFPIFNLVVETIRSLEVNHLHYHRMSAFQESHQTGMIQVFEFDRMAVRRLLDRARAEQRDLLLPEAMQVLAHYGIPTAPGLLAVGPAEAHQAAETLGYPVVIKVVAGQILHKSDVGGVSLNLKDGPAVEAAVETMLGRIRAADPGVEIEGVLVQPMARPGHDLILGGKQDPGFGPIVLVGWGGVFVEILEQVALRVAPITSVEAAEMIDGLRGLAMLKGARGQAPADIPALQEALLRLSQLMLDFPEITELDVNPLRLFDQGAGCCALDARLKLT